VKLLFDIASAHKEHIIMKFPFKMLLAGFLLTLSLISFSSFTVTEETTINSLTTVEELIIQVPESNLKNQPAVINAISSTKGVEYKGYCSSLQVYMMLVDRSVQEDNTFIVDIMKTQGLAFYIKDGSSIATVKAACGMDVNSNPQDSQQ
jgi:hypothetical protein